MSLGKKRLVHTSLLPFCWDALHLDIVTCVLDADSWDMSRRLYIKRRHIASFTSILNVIDKQKTSIEIVDVATCQMNLTLSGLG